VSLRQSLISNFPTNYVGRSKPWRCCSWCKLRNWNIRNNVSLLELGGKVFKTTFFNYLGQIWLFPTILDLFDFFQLSWVFLTFFNNVWTSIFCNFHGPEISGDFFQSAQIKLMHFCVHSYLVIDTKSMLQRHLSLSRLLVALRLYHDAQLYQSSPMLSSLWTLGFPTATAKIDTHCMEIPH